MATNFEWIGGSLAAVGSIALGIAGWWANRTRQQSHTGVELNQDRKANVMLDELQEENTTLRANSKADREAARLADSVSQRAVIDLRMAHKDMQRMRRKMNRAGIADSEIQASIDTNLGVLDALE